MLGGRLQEAVAMTESTVLGFQKNTFVLFLFNQRPFKTNCTVKITAFLNNQTHLALAIHFHSPNTE